MTAIIIAVYICCYHYLWDNANGRELIYVHLSITKEMWEVTIYDWKWHPWVCYHHTNQACLEHECNILAQSYWLSQCIEQCEVYNICTSKTGHLESRMQNISCVWKDSIKRWSQCYDKTKIAMKSSTLTSIRYTNSSFLLFAVVKKVAGT